MTNVHVHALRLSRAMLLLHSRASRRIRPTLFCAISSSTP